MTRSGKARKFSRKTLEKTGGAARRVMCVQMVLYTLIIAAVAALLELDGRGVLALGAFKPFLFPCAAFLMALVNLLINAPLTAIARKSGDGAFSRMNFGRVLIAMLLALLPAAVVLGLGALANLANVEWQRIMSWFNDWVMATLGNQIIAGCGAALCLVIFIYLCGVIGVFSRQMMLYMADNPDRMEGGSVGQIVKNGFAFGFAPVLMVIRSLFWFLLTLILTCALAVGVCFILSPDLMQPITSAVSSLFRGVVDSTWPLALGNFLMALIQLPAWAIAAVAALGCVWVLGLGLVFWPRFSMMRLYYHRLVMKDTSVM